MTIFSVTVAATQPQSSRALCGARRTTLATSAQSLRTVRGVRRTILAGQDQAVDVPAGTKLIQPLGISSTGARFGRPTVSLVGQSIFPTGIPSSLVLGAPAVGQADTQYIQPTGWSETELIGTPTLSHSSAQIVPAGIPPSSAVGIPIILTSAAGAPVPHNILIDRVTREIYPWPLNHATEDSVKTLGRRLTRSGISASGKLIQTRKVFLIRHPSHPGPMHLILHGTLLDRDQQQYQTFIRFFNECDDRTFDYIDASGDSYHVAIVQFDARRKVAPSRVDGSYFSYSLEVEVISVNQGAYEGYVV